MDTSALKQPSDDSTGRLVSEDCPICYSALLKYAMGAAWLCSFGEAASIFLDYLIEEEADINYMSPSISSLSRVCLEANGFWRRFCDCKRDCHGDHAEHEAILTQTLVAIVNKSADPSIGERQTAADWLLYGLIEEETSYEDEFVANHRTHAQHDAFLKKISGMVRYAEAMLEARAEIEREAERKREANQRAALRGCDRWCMCGACLGFLDSYT